MGNMKVKSSILGVVCLLLATCLGASVTYIVMMSSKNNNSIFDGNQTTVQTEASIAKVAAEVSPSVVSISTKTDNLLTTRQGAGTGIIMSEDGYVVTNKHVVKNSTSATVTTSDGVIYDQVEIVGGDPLNDVAFLKIKNASKLKPAQLGDSSSLQIGQSVLTIGNTLGEYQNTVTSGIVSGLGRPIAAATQSGSSAESLTDLVQTDAAINPGNSGGPLVNMAGQVIGINTAIVNNAQGIGFAIPINAIKGILDGVLQHGKVERAYLGVRYTDITPALAKQKRLDVRRGALADASGVEAGSPASKAGVKGGDIITKVGDLIVGQHGGVSSLIAQYRPGDEVEITLLRDGSEQKVKVKLDAYNATSQEANLSPTQPSKEPEDEVDFDELFGF